MTTATTELRTIEWRCDQCRQSIVDGDGYLELPDAEVTRQRKEEAEWEERHADSPVISGAALLEAPDRSHWLVHHRACDPDPHRSGYWFDVARCRSVSALLEWTAHLWAKFPDSDWDGILRRVSGG